uniref:Uncharacterized protein n=3 Tax=Anopheles funestus TaxID=62324 RepID=A0A4Y0APA7_ANOFN
MADAETVQKIGRISPGIIVSPDRHDILDISGSYDKSEEDDKIGRRKEETSAIDTRKSSLSAIEVSTLDDDSPLLTDFTTSSITYVSDRIDSSSLELMVNEPSMNFLKISGSLPHADKRNEIQSPGSCVSFTTTTSENIESISHDIEKCTNIGGAFHSVLPTEYERSVSLSDNAASDYSNESATKYNLPYDTESDGYDASTQIIKRKGIKSQECVAEPKQVKSTKLISVDQRHGSASPQSDITEYTESVSYVDSIIDSTNYGSALKQKEVQQDSFTKETLKDAYDVDVKQNVLTADHEIALPLDTSRKAPSESDESTQVKRRPKSKTTVTKVNLHKQTPIEISKRSSKVVDIRMGTAESTVTVTKSTTTSSRISTTSTRTHGYMQSTLSRDQKMLRPLSLTDSTHSSPSKTSHRTATTSQSISTYSPAHSAERKSAKSSKATSQSTQGLQEASGTIKHGASGTNLRKLEPKDTKPTTKSSTSRATSTVIATSSTVSSSSVSSQNRLSRSTVTTAPRKSATKFDSKEHHVVKKADKEQANLVTKSTLPAAVKISKDRVNKSLIPVKVQSSKRDSTPSPSRVSKSKSKPVTVSKSSERKMPKPSTTSEKAVEKKDQSVQLITKSIPKVTTTVRKESSKQILDDVYRCKSAMHYSYKDAVTFDHAEVPSSLPSSPSRLNKSSSNSTNVLTSEVFTRTIDSSKSIEVIYKQPSTSHELYRRVNEYRYNDVDMNFIETTDSSLSDSIALPSSSSEQESDATGKLKRSASPEGSPKQTSSSSAVTTMTTLTSKKNQLAHHPHHPTRPSKHAIGSGKRARTHSPAEPKYRKSDIWSRTDPPASSQELPDTSEDSDMYYYHHQQHYQLQQQHQLPPVAGFADRRLTASLDGIVLESSISPILDFRASTPPRMKYKFDYDSSMFPDTYAEHDDALQTSTRFEGDEYLELVKSEAGRLIDDVLEQSVSIVNSSQPGPMTIDRDLQPPSESEQYAIRSDILSSTDGDAFVKSPTIESMSGKSFDDNMSNPEYDALLLGTTFGATAVAADGQSIALPTMERDIAEEDSDHDKDDVEDGNGIKFESDLLIDGEVCSAVSVADDDNKPMDDGRPVEGKTPVDQAVVDAARKAKKIDRKYARLSSELGPEVLLDKNQEYDDAISQIKDEVSMLQSEYSKMSWDESVSMTTGDFGSSTPDNDLQETDLQLQTENNIPPTTSRIETKTIEAAPVSDASEAFTSGQNTVAIAASTTTITAANIAASATDFERKEHVTTVATGSIQEHSSSITSTELEKPSDSSSFEGQPVPKPRTSISSRTDTATRSSLLESFEHQDSIEQYPEPMPALSVDSERLRQGSITSDDLSNVAQKDSSEMVTSEEDISTGAKFFIGECSSDIITRSTTEKRTDYAFDNEGYTFSQDSQGTDEESRREAMEMYQQQIKQEDGFTLDSLKELDIGLRTSSKPLVVHSPVTATAQPVTKPSQTEQGEATILDTTTQQYSHMTIDEITIAKTLEEVKESLDAVQEELIEAVTDGTPIKQSPSEFEFKILPSTRYVQDPIYETNQEEAVAVSTATSAAITTTTIVSEGGLSDSEPKPLVSGPPIKIDEAPTGGSPDSSQLEMSARLRHGPHGVHAKGSRWSATDVDSSGESHYQSFEHTDSSRPLSSDIEQVLPYASSEYETALDHSIVPTSIGTEYHSAVSTLHSYPVSSHDSMKSFDSESSGNLASIESEATETLVPSTMDVDFDSSDAALIHDDSEDDLRDKMLLLDDKEELTSVASSIPIAMKRSHEMDFAELKSDSMTEESIHFGEQREAGVSAELMQLQEEKLLSSSIGTARDLVEAMQATSLEDVKMEPADEAKLGTSLEDGSILSISLSSASNLETIMENLSEKTTAGPVPTHVEIGLDAVTPTTSGTTGYIGDITLTSTVLKEGDVNFLNTQATTEIVEISTDLTGRDENEETVRKRGHKRTESTSIISGKFLADMGENRDSIESQDESLSQEASKPSCSERDEMREESSDSDYDRYESEYSRSFRAPVSQSKKKDKKAGEVFEKDFELDRRNSFSPSQSVIETIVEDVHAEIEQSDEAQRIMTSKSQLLQEYRESSSHNIPDIQVTDDFAEPLSPGKDDMDIYQQETETFEASRQETVTSTKAVVTVSENDATTATSTMTSTAVSASSSGMAKQTGIQYAKQEEYQLTEEQYQELIEQKYKAKLADTTTKYGYDVDDKDDSAGSDSFEMLEQPDISDEFVIVEEVAREAHEFDSEGKSMAIKHTKIEKKHDEDVEKILVKSAPAHTNAGSMYAANMRDDMMYEFEESPPTGGAEVDGAGVTMDLLNNGYPLEESKRWVEMQLAETQNFRYPYEDRLEDIKEEDTDFEVGSSRIGSIKDSFSSTPDYDMLAKRMASREHDDISMSSLQEFENLEHVISLENRKMQQGSQDSLSNGSFTRRFVQRGVHGDDISLSSLKEFEGLENACIEAHLIEIKAKEEAALLLSRSDESNKSNGSNGAKRSPPSNGSGVPTKRQHSAEGTSTQIVSSSSVTTTVGGSKSDAPLEVITTKVEKKITAELNQDAVSAVSTTTTMVTTISHEGQVRQIVDEEDNSHILTVSSDSLDGTRTATKQLPVSRDTLPSAHSSSDSLEIHSKNNVDVMTSSIDSIEFSKTGVATTRSSQSDSIEHMAQQQQPYRSDSTDSIEAQQHQQKLQQQAHQVTLQGIHGLSDTKRDSLESLAASSDNQSGFSSPTKSAHGSRQMSESGAGASGTYHQQQQSVQITSLHTVTGAGGRTMQKDISADSLTGPDAAFLTSTESLETSSTATNATYQNETDSQMSSSVTSCDSITMVDTVGPQALDNWDTFATTAMGTGHGAGVGYASSIMTTSMSAYSSATGGSDVIHAAQQQQQQAFRSSRAEATSSFTSSSVSVVSSSSASSTSYQVAQQQMGESELLSRELFPGEIAFDDVKETTKERMQSKSTEKEE